MERISRMIRKNLVNYNEKENNIILRRKLIRERVIETIKISHDS